MLDRRVWQWASYLRPENDLVAFEDKVAYCVDRLPDGAMYLLSKPELPTPAELIKWLPRRPRSPGDWALYIKLGIPDPGSGLPILMYFGSATGQNGYDGRCVVGYASHPYQLEYESG